MKAKIFTLFVFLFVGGIASAQFTDVLTTPMAPTIDGVADEADPWQEDLWVDQALNSGGSSTFDATSKFQLLHDADNIYMAVIVTDDTPNNVGAIGNTYERDCVEAFFHMSYTDVVGGDYGDYQDWTWQIRYQRDGDDGPFVDGTNIATLEADADFAWAVTTDAAGYTLETTLPIMTLVNGYADWDGESFKFDIQTADNTTGAAGGRTQQMFWNNNSDDQWRDTQVFGELTLSADAITIGAVEADLRGDLGRIYVQNDYLRMKNIQGDVNIFSVSGALVKKAVVNSTDASIDISALNSGIYFVKTEKLTVKVIK